MKNQIKIIFTGGGSGGHTMPAFSMIDSLKEYCVMNNILCNILYIGSFEGIEKETANRYKINYKSIKTGKLRRYFSLKNVSDIFNIFKGLIESIKIIDEFKPDLIFSTGGFVSVTPVIASFLKKVPIIIHEQTIDAGLANRISAIFADKVCVTFSESIKFFPSKKTIITGIPLRREVLEGSIDSARKRFKFDYSIPTVFFTGGGLGCHSLNSAGLGIVEDLLDICNVIFQTGKSNNKKDFFDMRALWENLTEDKKERFVVYDFINEEIGDIYKISDIGVARSGAGTVCEFIRMGIPAIFIPLAIATKDEQFKNAMVMKRAGSAEIIDEKNLSEENLKNLIIKILQTTQLKEMKENISKINNPDGKLNILKIILDEIGK
jgi:UDP-N-acetylglucosamine--N-acetylmuramyl-(pentapeptide) pyrophosphoryl-undecaprenol N-acetylglucosamine transferase